MESIAFSFFLKKNVASDILAPSADATHLHIARAAHLSGAFCYKDCGAISYNITEKSCHEAAL
jgi:hypothetical protein